MVERIEFNKKELAIILRSQYKENGIHFFTSDDAPQQLAHMKRDKNYIIEPHVHHSVERKISLTQEVLLIKSGIVRVDFYSDKKIYIESRALYKGDVILLMTGGHGFKMLEDSEIIEIKQGPYVVGKDKERFATVLEDKVTLL